MFIIVAVCVFFVSKVYKLYFHEDKNITEKSHLLFSNKAKTITNVRVIELKILKEFMTLISEVTDSNALLSLLLVEKKNVLTLLL